MSITERCSLNCEYCDAEMLTYQNPINSDIDTIKESTHNLLSQLAWVTWFRVMGGEPFLHPQLGDILEFLSKYKQIRSLRVVTNGTIIPSKDLLDILKKHKIALDISIYSCVEKQQSMLIDCLKKHKIDYALRANPFWVSFGDYQKRDLTIEQLKQSKKMCLCHKFRHIEHGKLFFCKRVRNLEKQSNFKSNPGDFVDLLDINNLHSRIRETLKIDFVVACDHCNPPWDRPVVPVAKQIERKK